MNSHLNVLVNYGGINKRDKLLACFFPPYSIHHNVSSIVKNIKKNKIPEKCKEKKIIVDNYNGSNKFVKKMQYFLQKYLSNELVGAYIHGSLGSYEEINYSDFDALVIIKDEVLHDRKRFYYTVKKLFLAKKIMLEYDPLQHHGWFVMCETDLEYYPQTYFPVELFSHSKSLLDVGHELNLGVLPEEMYDYQTPFRELSNGILNKISPDKRAKNIFQLKSFLSEFMLLPAFYYQANEKKGIYKKYSFDETKKDMPEDIWSIMDEVSMIREEWTYEISWFKRTVVEQGCFLSHQFAKKFSPKIPTEIAKVLDNEFYRRVSNFTLYLQDKIKQGNMK